MWFVSQEILEQILRTELEKYNCSVEFGKELIGFEQDNHNVVGVTQTHTGDGNSTKEQITASYLVGADGGKGTTNDFVAHFSDISFNGGIVRRLLNLKFLGSPKDDDGMIVTNAIVDNLSTHVRSVSARISARILTEIISCTFSSICTN
jgi:hypothetical protein